MMTIISTDARSRVVLPGHPNRLFLLRENADGSLLLEPASVVSESQEQYDQDPALKALLARALTSPTVRRRRRAGVMDQNA
jgi:hypothetical protein